MTEGDPKSKQLWDSYTITPDQNGKWSLTVTDLPKARVNDDGTAGADYLYYIEEDTLPGYIVIYKNNEGIKSGTITLINRDKIGYDLPKTGGKGTYPYTMGGTALTVASLILLFYKRKRHRKEGTISS
jgi:LPXTG-motif cell wall-anchored protein